MDVFSLLEQVTKIGIFFFIAYLHSLLVSFISLILKLRKPTKSDWLLLTHLPFSSGVLLPVFTTFLFAFPLGFTYHTQRSFQDEMDSYLPRFFALFFHLFLHFALLSLVYVFPSLMIWEKHVFADKLFLYFMIIHLTFIFFNLLPLFPSIMGFFVLSKTYQKFLKKQEPIFTYKAILFYKVFSALILIFMFLGGFYFFILKKIQLHLWHCLSFSLNTILGIGLAIFFAFLIMLIFYRFSILKYHQGIQKMFHKIFQDREKEEENNL